MLVLVTGAAGRIGSHVSRLLHERGDSVRGFVLPGDPNTARLAATGAEIVEGRLEDRPSVIRAATGVDAVIHLGAALTSRGGTDDQFFEVNMQGTFNVLMAVRDHAPGIRRVVFASSDSVYFESWRVPPDELPVTEQHPRRPGLIYGVAKLAGEEMCLTFQRAYGIPATIARFSGVSEPWEWIDPKSVYGKRMFVHEAYTALAALPEFHSLGRRGEIEEARLEALRRLEDGTDQLFVEVAPDGTSPTFCQADARDIAAAVIRLMDSPAAVGEAFNLAGPPYVDRDLITHIATRLGLRCTEIPTPLVRPSWYLDTSKAERLAGVRITRSIFDMVDEAVAPRAGDAGRGRA